MNLNSFIINDVGSYVCFINIVCRNKLKALCNNIGAIACQLVLELH